MKKLLLTASLLLGTVLPQSAAANHWMQSADPQVVNAFNELIMVYGNACQMGNGQACQVTQMLQQEAGSMLSAGYECQTAGNQQACQYYNYVYGQLSALYSQTQQAMTQGQMAAPQTGYAQGTTHAQRMAQIHAFGQQNTANFNERMRQSDIRHQQFLKMLRE